MLELNRQVRDFYRAYEKKHLHPETALQLASDFALDLINAMGDELTESTPLQKDWQVFAPFEFLLELNNTLKKFKESGLHALSSDERDRLSHNRALLGALVRAALKSHPDAFPGEEHFQIPHAVARELLVLSEK